MTEEERRNPDNRTPSGRTVYEPRVAQRQIQSALLARPATSLRPMADLLLKSFVRWRRDGTRDRLLAHAQTKSDVVGELEWKVSVDRAPSHAPTSTPQAHVTSRAIET